MVRTTGHPEGRKPSTHKYQILVRYPEVRGRRAPWEETDEYFDKKIDAETFAGVETIAGQGEEFTWRKVKR
jgi:hypothetical protein